MKKFLRVSLISIIAVIILSLSLLTAFADGTATVNGKEAKVGDTVTYTLYIADSTQNIVGIDARFFFDQEALELVSVNTDNLGDSTVVNDNMNNDGMILMNNAYIAGGKGLACKDKVSLATLTFKVIKAIPTTISYYIPYIYDFDMVNIYNYTFTYELTVEGETVIENVPPVLAGDEELGKLNDLGDFENVPEGTGSGIKPTAAPTKAPAGSNQNGQSGSQGGQSGTAENGDFNVFYVIIPVIVLMVAAIVVLVIIKQKQGNNEAE